MSHWQSYHIFFFIIISLPHIYLVWKSNGCLLCSLKHLFFYPNKLRRMKAKVNTLQYLLICPTYLVTKLISHFTDPSINSVLRLIVLSKFKIQILLTLLSHLSHRTSDKGFKRSLYHILIYIIKLTIRVGRKQNLRLKR